MNTQDLKNLMNTYIGGSDTRTRHMFNRRFIMTEGVMAVAQAAGCFWLLDIIATEVAPICLKKWDHEGNGMTFFKVESDGQKASLWLEEDEGEPRLWERNISYTDFPAGTWTFYLAIDGIICAPQEVLVMLLPQEY